MKINLANKNNYGPRRNLSDIKYIVVHYTANDGDSDESNARYFQQHIVNASAHYFVDNDSVTQSVPDDFVAWSVGGDKYGSCLQTGGGKFYGKCTNKNSVSIELCDSKKNGKYDFTENTLKQAADLIKTIMKKYRISEDNVIRHFDVTGKICPKPFVDSLGAWKEFKGRLVDQGDKELSDAVLELIKHGIKINGPSWNSMEKIGANLKYADRLVNEKLGGLDAIHKKLLVSGQSLDLDKWKEAANKKTYTVNMIRSLIIKYAISLSI